MQVRPWDFWRFRKRSAVYLLDLWYIYPYGPMPTVWEGTAKALVIIPQSYFLRRYRWIHRVWWYYGDTKYGYTIPMDSRLNHGKTSCFIHLLAGWSHLNSVWDLWTPGSPLGSSGSELEQPNGSKVPMFWADLPYKIVENRWTHPIYYLSILLNI